MKSSGMNSTTMNRSMHSSSQFFACLRRARLITFQFALMAAVLLGLASTSPAQTLTTLHSFSGAPDGANPDSAPVLDPDGNLYGATFNGGSSTFCQSGCGIVFKIATDGTESVLYSFAGNNDGANPNFLGFSGGQLVGTTLVGGLNGHKHKTFGFGTIFFISLTGQEFVWHNFIGSVHAYPQGLTIMTSGNIIGTTAGVSMLKGAKRYNGSVFNQVTKNDHALLKFVGSNSADGSFPTGGLAIDPQGNIYGTTMFGGSGEGVAFEVTPQGVETLLHTFTGSQDGGVPTGGLIRDAQGNLYGTAAEGGQFSQGTVFEITSSGLTTLHSFNGTDGAGPQSLLIFDGQGNLYGTTYSGGAFNQGTIFELNPSGQETVLYNFSGGADGAHPQAALLFDGQGNLYGTTAAGGASGLGTIFKLVP